MNSRIKHVAGWAVLLFGVYAAPSWLFVLFVAGMPPDVRLLVVGPAFFAVAEIVGALFGLRISVAASAGIFAAVFVSSLLIQLRIRMKWVMPLVLFLAGALHVVVLWLAAQG